MCLLCLLFYCCVSLSCLLVVSVGQGDMSSERAIRRDEGERLARVSITLLIYIPIKNLMTTNNNMTHGFIVNMFNVCLQEYSVPFMETSAKTGVNVELAFTAVAKYDCIIF